MTNDTCCVSCQATIDKLAAENEKLRQTIHSLLAVGGAMNDAVRIWTMPTIRNN